MILTPRAKIVDFTTKFGTTERNNPMSQGIFLKNKNGVVVVADSARTIYDEKSETFKASHIPLQKVFYNKQQKLVWVTVGNADFEEGINFTLEDETFAIRNRLEILGVNISSTIVSRKERFKIKFPVSFELILCAYSNHLLHSYYLHVTDDKYFVYDDDRDIQSSIGLYSNEICLDKITDVWTIYDMLEVGIRSIEQAITFDGKNHNKYVGGEIQWVTMDKEGKIIAT